MPHAGLTTFPNLAISVPDVSRGTSDPPHTQTSLSLPIMVPFLYSKILGEARNAGEGVGMCLSLQWVTRGRQTYAWASEGFLWPCQECSLRVITNVLWMAEP